MDKQIGAPALTDQMNAHLNNLKNASHMPFSVESVARYSEILADAAALAPGRHWMSVQSREHGAYHELARQAATECGNVELLTHAMGQQP